MDFVPTAGGILIPKAYARDAQDFHAAKAEISGGAAAVLRAVAELLAEARLPGADPQVVRDAESFGWRRPREIDPRYNRAPWVDRDGVPAIGGGATAGAYSVVGGTAFSAATGAKTAILAIPPAGHGLTCTEWGISTDGVTSSAVPAVVDMVRSDGTTAGTSGVAPTITQVRGRVTAGSAPTAGSNYTAEPTALVVVKKFYLAQLMGLYIYQAPLGREVECDSNAGTVKGGLGLRINSSATVNVLSWIEVESLG